MLEVKLDLNRTGSICAGRGRRCWVTCAMAMALLVAAVGGAHAQSGGFALSEDGGPINGTSQAGSAAVARDAQTAWLNPAGMTRLASRELMLTAQPFKLQFTFQPSDETTETGPGGGDQGSWLPGGALFYAAPVSEKVAWGLSVTSPAGLALDPTDDWVGRYFMVKTQFAAINIEPSIGVKLSEHWAIGGGIDFQYAKLEQEIAVNRPLEMPDSRVAIDGDSWQVGGSLSLLWDPTDQRRLGLRYRSVVKHDLSGDMKAFMDIPISTDLTIPQNLTFSLMQQVSPSVALLADLGWQDWSAFDKTIITVDGENDLQIEIPREFKDTWTFSLGAHWRVDPDWLLMAGGGYTSSAVDDDKRTPDMPADEQIRASLGAEYEFNARWRVGFNYTYLWLGNNAIDGTATPLTGRVVGDYDAAAHLFGLYGSLQI